MLESVDVQRFADCLFNAWSTRTPVLSPLLPDGVDESDAYAIQDALIERLPGHLVGYKLGFTSPAMREQFGVPHPNYGQICSMMQLQTPNVERARFIHPRVEPEIAVHLAQPVGWPCDLMMIRSAIAAVYPALEIVDSRFRDYRFHPLENTADNSSAAAYRLGAARHPDELGPLEAISVTLYRNGRAIDHGAGSDAFGNPLLAISWLAESLSHRDRRLERGQLILTGGLTRAYLAYEGDEFTADFGRLGTVTLFFS
ncbi:MAG: 2-oxopent-4-enoate hydratase [Chloroflexota bacterium]